MFKRLSLTRGVAAFLLVCAAGAAQAQAYISSTISGQLAPGVYGQINIGNAAPPPLVYAQPMWGAQGSRGPQVEPMYMWVPPGHARDWRRHCSRYQACGRPVYFLRDAPSRWRDKGPKHHHGRDWKHERRDDRHWQREERRHDRHERRDWDRRDDDDRGRGHGRGHGRHDD
ncbi:hypothetical protein KUF54_07705 [Comamonas sp. Y33R10-2]|uniref:hypothetical protein n=1 Tax=Comamonas sp. Y33R10-2 TaxID=2853257 RepID=UPI001C5CAB8C|nr:hypothetical protein [Comamonas sp. Y33R10-2]QXZ11061.1 hypothetical protein KUF54_07705 [Comamonas sp. Y33R10-2]